MIKGTRHTSAARHTYDCPDMLAFVVSTDGPVTVFCDGQRIADLKRAAFKKTSETIDGLAATAREDGADRKLGINSSGRLRPRERLRLSAITLEQRA